MMFGGITTQFLVSWSVRVSAGLLGCALWRSCRTRLAFAEVGAANCEGRKVESNEGFVGMDSVQSMASSSSSTGPSSERTSQYISQTEMEMESSRARHWSHLDYSTTESEWSAETNSKYFDLLKEDPQWGRFFTDFETLEVGEKISGGAQADIYAARRTPDGPFDLVVKVMKGDAPLQAFQAQWPIGMLSARSKYKHLFDLPLITILGGTVLRDKRLRGRFAFVMYRRWGDLRVLIDRRMKQERSTRGPFPMDEAIHLMLSIAEDMDTLHNKHNIIHRDLKASNVLVWGEPGEDLSLVAPPTRVAKMGSLVADFECSVGVLGTGFWRAPEILGHLKARVPNSEVKFTHESDVYSYGMTCYEIVTGCIPFDGLGGEDTISQILQGQHPELPHDLPEFVRNIIVGCWQFDPMERPTFSAICVALKMKRGPNPVSVVIDNTTKRGVSVVKVEQRNNPQPLALLKVMAKLMDMDLSILRASDSSSTEMTTQYFEVTDCKGRKVVNDKSIANITKGLSLPVKMKWISESLGTSMDENTRLQMHIIEVVAERSASFLGAISKLLVASNFRIHSAGCWTHKGRVECVIYVEGTRTDALLWTLRYQMEHFAIIPRQMEPCYSDGDEMERYNSDGDEMEHFKIIVHKVASEEFSHLSRRLHSLKSTDLTRPPSSSNIRVHQRKGFQPFNVVVCLEERRQLVDLSRSLVGSGYKINSTSVEYPGPYKFLKGRVNETEDIDVQTLGEDESEKISGILDIATQRGCLEGNSQLFVSGPSEDLLDDLMRSLLENDLVVTGGQVCRGDYSYREYLRFFVTRNPTVGAS